MTQGPTGHPTGHPADHAPLSEVLGERYTAIERIATGGMGEVWRARDEVLHRDVACKILKRELADDEDCRSRFLNEARTAASLHHPGIASVFDFGEEEGQPPYLVMELVEGQTLGSLMRAGRIGFEQVRDLIAQTAAALGEAHRRGLVHRDVKPGNILVQPTGEVKLTDFGIARAADSVALTRTGEVIGTPSYLSPEQADGSIATARSDVYSLGVVLFEALAGTRPFVADSPIGIALAHIRQDVPDLPEDVPEDLAAITRRALAKDPAERYADGDELAAALTGTPVADPEATQLIAGLPTGPPEPTTRTPLEKGNRERRLLLLALAGLVALILIAAAVNALSDGPKSPTDTTTPTSSPSHSNPAVRKVQVDPKTYLGKPVAEVRAALRALGLATDVVPTRKANPGGHAAGTVAALSPTGKVATTTTVKLTLWGAVQKTTTSTSTPKTTTSSPKHHKPKGKGRHKK